MAKKEATELAVQEDHFPTTAPDYMNQGPARGQENVGIEDLTIPRIDVIQSQSKQRKKNDPKYIEGAEEGMLFNTVSGKLYGSKLFICPVYFRKEWVIWKNQDAGGGFNGAFATEAEAKAVMRENGWDTETLKKDGHDIPTYEAIDTGQHFCLVLDTSDMTTEEAVISMSKSKMKASRQLNTLAKMAGGDRFSRVYEVSAVEDQNKQGQDFFNMSVKQLGFAPEPVYRQAEKLYEAISSGQRDVNREEANQASSADKPEYA